MKEWVLELKALTDKTISGNNIGPKASKDAIEKGLTQAIAYRDKEHARKAALCCYDMRQHDEGDESCFVAIAEEAAEEKIYLWRWFLHRSSESLRKADRSARKTTSATRQGE